MLGPNGPWGTVIMVFAGLAMFGIRAWATTSEPREPRRVALLCPERAVASLACALVLLDIAALRDLDGDRIGALFQVGLAVVLLVAGTASLFRQGRS